MLIARSVSLLYLLSICSGISIVERFENLFYGKRNTLENNYEESKKAKTVSVKLYYESLCPDCRKFDTTKLLPTLVDLAGYMKLETYPYGNARTTKYDNGTIEVRCQHGPAECYGNQLHACTLEKIQDHTEAVKFNGCMMSYNRTGKGSDDDAATQCGDKFSIDSEPIKECAKSNEGFDLLLKYGKESKKIGFKYVPYVLVNGVQYNTDSDADFKKTVCAQLDSPPDTCMS